MSEKFSGVFIPLSTNIAGKRVCTLSWYDMCSLSWTDTESVKKLDNIYMAIAG